MNEQTPKESARKTNFDPKDFVKKNTVNEINFSRNIGRKMKTQVSSPIINSPSQKSISGKHKMN
jgi:ABC-type multidrug transport system permease subunit